MANLLNKINLNDLKEVELLENELHNKSFNRQEITHRQYNRPKDTQTKIQRDKLRKAKQKNKDSLIAFRNKELEEI